MEYFTGSMPNLVAGESLFEYTGSLDYEKSAFHFGPKSINQPDGTVGYLDTSDSFTAIDEASG